MYRIELFLEGGWWGTKLEYPSHEEAFNAQREMLRKDRYLHYTKIRIVEA